MAGQQDLGLQRDHLVERARPVGRVTLNLLRVPAVRRRPDEHVARAQDLARRHPRPRVIVGLAARVMHLEGLAADVDAKHVAVQDVGIAERGGPRHRLREPELPLVDDRVVAGREHVAVEARRHRLVRDDPRSRPAVGRRFFIEWRNTEDVIDVSVRVHGGVQARGIPGAEPLVMHLREGEKAGVDQHEPIGRPKRIDVGQSGHEDRVRRDLFVRAGRPQRIDQRMRFFDRDLAIPEALGRIEDAARHRQPPSMDGGTIPLFGLREAADR